jgi:hypothetical protein
LYNRLIAIYNRTMIGHRTHRRKLLLGQSAVTYLTLAVAFGPNRALFFILIAAFLTAFFTLCRPWPWLSYVLLGFIRGLLDR